MAGPAWARRLFGALLLTALVGCQGTDLRNYSLGNNSDMRRDLSQRLDETQRQWNDAKGQVEQALAQVGQLQKQLDGQTDIQTLLEQRVDNLLRENQQLHQELTAIVMNATDDDNVSPVSAIQNATSSSAKMDAAIPVSVERVLAALADHHSGVSFDADEAVIRISSVELFSKGDEISARATPLLKDLADVMNAPEAKRFNFLIVAHAPPNGAVPKELVPYYPTVWHLTAHQAIAVEQFLEEAGLAPTRVGVVSYAGQQPLVAGNDDASRRTNSRVEIFFTPPDPPTR